MIEHDTEYIEDYSFFLDMKILAETPLVVIIRKRSLLILFYCIAPYRMNKHHNRMIKADFVIVGAGLTGSTIARILTDHDQDVIILDRKNHLAGNVYDYRHESGAMIHKYGPHYFRCGSEKIWNFLNRFTEFYNWSATLLSKVEAMNI